ncbi:MAG: uroporphyrinogen-III synthase, partial [Planctomycetes bacterium]|nr:uroporphyrinogen-III synthase [Planctomycetota bacterium]
RRDGVVAAFAKTRTLIRGPKPGRALREIGLTATLIAQTPTTDGVIASLRTLELKDLSIGVQLYNEQNPPLEQFLREAGANALTVQPYIYAPAADAERIAELFRGMAAGEVAAIIFTSSPQIDRLFEVALERGAMALLRDGLARTLVAAVGPIVQENLQNVMKNLVQHLKRVV